MTNEDFDALRIGDSIYRFDEGVRVYVIEVKTLESCRIDRPCIISAAQAAPGRGKKMMRQTVVKHFCLSALDAIAAERERLQDIILYHRQEKRKTIDAITKLNKIEAVYDVPLST